MILSKRRKSREVKIGKVRIGGSNPIAVQSMCTAFTHDVPKVVKQINGLEEAGCEIVRVTIPDMKSAEAISQIKKQINIPLVADIHFDYRLALKAIEGGIDKVRINPGNIGSIEKTTAVVKAAKDAGIPIRVGVNSGSLRADLVDKYHGVTPEAMVESALEHVKILENLDFRDTVVSLKCSDVYLMIESYRLFAKKTDYPLHLGVTEAGTPFIGSIRSSIGIGSLLSEGIGDTIRCSITAEPVEEMKVAYEILKSLGLRSRGAMLVSCPTCGRTQLNLIKIANEVEKRLENVKEPIKVAVMGCVVNGPGESRDADVGLCGGAGVGAIFRKGKVVRKVDEKDVVDALFEEIDKIIAEREKERQGKK